MTESYQFANNTVIAWSCHRLSNIISVSSKIQPWLQPYKKLKWGGGCLNQTPAFHQMRYHCVMVLLYVSGTLCHSSEPTACVCVVLCDGVGGGVDLCGYRRLFCIYNPKMPQWLDLNAWLNDSVLTWCGKVSHVNRSNVVFPIVLSNDFPQPRRKPQKLRPQIQAHAVQLGCWDNPPTR